MVAWRQLQADICGHTGGFQAMEAASGHEPRSLETSFAVLKAER